MAHRSLQMSFAEDIDQAVREQAGVLLEELLPNSASPLECTVSMLPGGAINRNLLVEHGSQRFVLRIAPPSALNEIVATDMVNSAAAARIAGKAELGPAVFGVSMPEGHSLIEFLEGGTLDHTRLREGNNLEAVGDLLARLHRLPVDSIRDRPVFVEVRRFVQTARERHSLPAVFERIEGPLAACEELFDRISGSVFSHRDVNPQNLVATPDGLRLLDYDYAGIDTPYLDIAMIAQYGELNEEETKRVLKAAVSDLSPVDVCRVELMRFIHAVREWSWCLTAPAELSGLTDTLVDVLPGGGQGQLDFYEGYRQINLEGALGRLSDSRFDDWLGLAGSNLGPSGHRSS